MEKALQRLAEANLTSKSTSPTSVQDSTTQTIEDNIRKVNIAIVDTPPTTPSTRTNYVDQFKGIPKALLEKVSALFYYSHGNTINIIIVTHVSRYVLILFERLIIFGQL